MLSVEDHASPTVAVQVWYHVGAKDDPQGRSGFAHLFEHLMFKSTKHMASEQMDRLTEDVGGYIERVQAVTPAQIQSYAAEHFGVDGTRVVVVGDAALFAAAVARTHPHAVVLAYDGIDLDSPTLTP